jgi:FAD/FMN-containing dehydrogenase
MNKIIEIGDDFVTVEPGMIKGVLDRELAKRKKFLPPDPASGNYCTIGGMIADNSSGAHSLGYGSTIDALDEVCVIYSDGSLATASADCVDDRLERLKNLLAPHLNLISSKYPIVTKNSCGYRLDAAIASGRFQPQKIFAASEGTLGMITSAKLKVRDIPLFRHLLVIGFKDLLAAISRVPAILKLGPVALEMLDHTATDPRNHKGFTDSGCLLFAEFVSDSANIESVSAKCREQVSESGFIVEAAYDDKSIATIWNARKSALSQVMKMTVGSRKPIGLIEDTVVNPDFLYEHALQLLLDYRENALDYVMYGHVGNGNMHTRPLIDTSSEREIGIMQSIAHKTFERVVRNGGSITGEHGDGLARAAYIEMMYGPEIFSLFRQVKTLFDPKFTLNPGKKVAAANQ